MTSTKKKCYHKNPIEWLSLISRKKKVCLSVCLFLFTQLMNNEFGYPWLPMKNTKFSTNSIVSSRFLAHNKSRRRQHCALSEQMHNLSASANALVECRRWFFCYVTNEWQFITQRNKNCYFWVFTKRDFLFLRQVVEGWKLKLFIYPFTNCLSHLL